MTQNIDKILKRGDRLEDLVDKTTELETTVRAMQFFINLSFLFSISFPHSIHLGYSIQSHG